MALLRGGVLRIGQQSEDEDHVCSGDPARRLDVNLTKNAQEDLSCIVNSPPKRNGNLGGRRSGNSVYLYTPRYNPGIWPAY